jgi:hypothetical protein
MNGFKGEFEIDFKLYTQANTRNGHGLNIPQISLDVLNEMNATKLKSLNFNLTEEFKDSFARQVI